MAVVTVDRSGRAPFARLRGGGENGRLASRHADTTTALRAKRFGNDFVGRVTTRSAPQIVEDSVYRSMRHWMLQLDPPDHGRLRSL